MSRARGAEVQVRLHRLVLREGAEINSDEALAA